LCSPDDSATICRVRVGSQHASAKLTEDVVREMRKAREEGATIDQVHQRYGVPAGVSHSQVEKICYRLAWKHVD